jgi:methylated-DNA-protein-cysteine methyltransferase-like protein
MRARIAVRIRQVPRGKVSTYGDIARASGFPKGARQVVATLNRTVGLPWHRIVGAGGEIKTRGDDAFEQRMRLESEGVVFRGRRVNMAQFEYKFSRSKPSRSREAR